MGCQLLMLSKKVLGTEHSDTLNRMHLMTWVLNYQGKYDEAEEMGWQTLMLNQKVFGTEHSKTLRVMQLLTQVLNVQGKHEEAESLRKTWQE